LSDEAVVLSTGCFSHTAFSTALKLPIAVYLIVRFGVSPRIWLTPLMIPGTQWYILIAAVIEAVAGPPSNGQADLADIARLPGLRAKDLFAVAEALHILEFAELKDGTIKLTAAGTVFAQSEDEERKRLFKEHLLRFVPFAAHIRHVLDEREGHSAPRVRFKSELEDHLSASDAEKTLRTVIGWGRYAEIFSYDDLRRMFSSNHSTG
jgi:NitT/TauT family transport system ATP-binding protein